MDVNISLCHLAASHPGSSPVSEGKTRRWNQANGRSQALILGLFVNLVLTLGSVAFTYYSLHRFDSRLTAVEQNLQLTSSPDQLADRVIAQPTFKQSSPSGPQMKEDDRVKRAANRQFMCHKCSSACLKSIGHRNVSFFLPLCITKLSGPCNVLNS